MNVLKLNHLASMAAAPIIWSVHFIFCYVLVSLACAFGWSDARVAGMNTAQVGIALASVAALALLAYTAFINLDKYRSAPPDPQRRNGMSAFVALNSVLLCGLSAVALIWVAFPAMMLPVCAS